MKDRQDGSVMRPAGVVMSLIFALAAAGIAVPGPVASGEATGPPEVRLSHRPAGVAKCIKRWNRATLGSGRRFAAATAANGPVALLSISSDDVCIIAFPELVSRRSGQGLFLSYRRGDYSLMQSPLTAGGSLQPRDASALESAASQFTNVRFTERRGVISERTSPVLGVAEFGLLGSSERCQRFLVGTTVVTYRVRHRTASCLDTRIITWAWSEGRGDEVPTQDPGISKRTIIGWTCEGAEAEGDHPDELPLSCTRGDREFEVVTVILRAVPVSR